MEIKPYNQTDSKKEQVAGMFDNIAPKYDFLNHFLSLNIDKLWRKKVVRRLGKSQPQRILDVATGTADLALAALKCKPQRIDGIDISEGMLAVGEQKIKDAGAHDIIFLKKADAENIPFDDNTFDAEMVAFGVRNFENLEKGLAEMLRVLKPGGTLYVLEFTMPRRFPVKQFYSFYFKYILPVLGRMVSKDSSAYTYLPASVGAFPQYEKFTGILTSIGYQQANYTVLSFGIACLYSAKKTN